MGAAKSRVASLSAVANDRRTQWPHLLGATLLQRSFPPTYYRSLIALPHANLTEEVLTEIAHMTKDLPRLIPPEHREALQSILIAFVLHLPVIGYLPCIICLASSILEAVHDAELTFWCLVALVERTVAGCPLGTADFIAEMDVFATLVKKHLPRLRTHLLGGRRGEYFTGLPHGLMMLGAGGWIGMLCSPNRPHRDGRGGGHNVHLAHVCIDAVCLFGFEAAHLLALEVLRRAQGQLLLAVELEDLLTVSHSVESVLMQSTEESRKFVADLVASRTFGRALHNVVHLRRRFGRTVQPGLTNVAAGRATMGSLKEPYRRWSPWTHVLCDPSMRACVRAVLMLQRRHVNESLLAIVPPEIWIEHVLSHLELPSQCAEGLQEEEPDSEMDVWPDPW